MFFNDLGVGLINLRQTVLKVVEKSVKFRVLYSKVLCVLKFIILLFEVMMTILDVEFIKILIMIMKFSVVEIIKFNNMKVIVEIIRLSKVEIIG